MDTASLFLDEGSAVPVYAQLSEQVLAAVGRGDLRAGDRLPSVRDVAAALGVNPNTVNHAYAHLERFGIVETRRGRGTFVAARKRRPAEVPPLLELTEPFVARARSLGYAGRQIVTTVAAVVRKSP
jgi:GntR family transcriptional regulator